MMQFLKFDTEQAYEYSWQFLIGYLTQAQQAGKGLTSAQLTHVLDQMQQFAAEKSPHYAPLMGEVKQLLKPKATPPAPAGPETWPAATYAQVAEYSGLETLVFTTTESGRMLKTALNARWPGAQWRIKTDRYHSTKLLYVYDARINYNELREFVTHFSGKQSAAPMDGFVALYHLKPEPDGPPRLVEHGLGYVRLCPHDKTGWDVLPNSGKRCQFKNDHN